MVLPEGVCLKVGPQGCLQVAVRYRRKAPLGGRDLDLGGQMTQACSADSRAGPGENCHPPWTDGKTERLGPCPRHTVGWRLGWAFLTLQATAGLPFKEFT